MIVGSFFSGAWASGPLHWSGKKTRWDRKNGIVELFEDARVTQPGQVLTADYIYLDLNKRHVDAKGNCVYRSETVTIESEEIHMGIDSRLGSFIEGRVSDGAFLLQGEVVEKIGVKRYRTKNGKYTTCVDCAPSWSFEGGEVELEVEGYAYLENVKVRIKDAPFVWFPYLVVPIKRQRQTGLLPIRFGIAAATGSWVLQRLFLATSDWSDMTLGLGWYSERGRRLEWEGRYQLTPFSYARANVFSVNDLEGDPVQNRWAIRVDQRQELPWGITQKIAINEVSDLEYPIDFPGDIGGREDPAMTSEVQLAHVGKQFSASLEAKRHRNLLWFEEPTKFDQRTVQILPRARLATSDRFLFGTPIVAGIQAELTRFDRAAGAFDYDPSSTPGDPIEPGVDPIRKATRVSATPRLYASFRPFDLFSYTPRVEYRSYFYSFDQEYQDLSRGYLLVQNDLSMQFEKVWGSGTVEDPKMKHLLRPKIRYARIPYINEPSHPFLTQVDRETGYAFDQFDDVPLTSTKNLENYYIPLGNSLSYEVVSQWIQKNPNSKGALPQYTQLAKLTAGQSIDFSELEKPVSERIPLTRFFSTASLNLNPVGFSAVYFYYPHLNRLLPPGTPEVRSPHEVNLSLSYSLSEKPLTYQNPFRRSLSLSYYFRKLNSSIEGMIGEFGYSLTDHLLPVIGAQYDFLTQRFIRSYLDLEFRSPSKCWHIHFRAEHFVDNGIAINFNFALDFTGQNGNLL